MTTQDSLARASGDLTPLDFETVWSDHRRTVFAAAMRAAGDRNVAEDIVQAVAERVWRGLPRFRRDCPVLAWIMTILRRETAREFRRRAEERQRLEPIGDDHTDALVAQPAQASSRDAQIRAMVVAAAREGLLTHSESVVVQTRLADPDASWDDVQNRVGLPAATCASHHCRAIPKLRVHLFLTKHRSLGGRRAIEAALGQVQASNTPLTVEEAAAFETYVLGAGPIAKAARNPALRAACNRVIRHLEDAESGDL